LNTRHYIRGLAVDEQIGR